MGWGWGGGGGGGGGGGLMYIYCGSPESCYYKENSRICNTESSTSV